MKKRMYAVLAILTVFALVLGVVSCGGGSSTTAKDITVKFDLKGGKYDGNATIPDVKIKENSKLGDKYPDVTKLTGPTATPYFEDWVDANKKVYGPNDKISKSLTLEAKWTASSSATKVTITFNTNKPADYTGIAIDAVTSVQLDSGAAIGDRLPAKPTAGGLAIESMNFLGWWTAAEGGTQILGATSFLTDTTVYAHWHVLAADEYTITFDLNWATVPKTFERTAKTGVGIADWPADPQRPDYRFVAWVEFENGNGLTYDATSVTFPDGSVNGTVANKIWAKWESLSGPVVEVPPDGTDLDGAEKVTLDNGWHAIYKFDMGTTKWSDIKEMTVEYMVGPSNYTKKGVPRTTRIMGNYVDSDFKYNTIRYTEAGADVTKKAAVAPGDSKNAAYIMGAITTINQDGNMTIEDYTASQGVPSAPWQWFTMTYPTDQTNKNNNYNQANYPTDTTASPLYFGIGLPAMSGNGGCTQYIRNVTLVSNDGTKNVVGKPLVYKVHKELYPAYWGYDVLDGTNGSKEVSREWADGSSFSNVAVDLDVAVTFDYNFTGKPADLVVDILKGQAIPAADWPTDLPTNPLGAFVRWNSKADGTGTDITSAQVFNTDTTVYAIWAPPIIITLNPNGGNWDGSTTNKTVTIGQGGTLNATQLAAPVKAGFRFDKWTKADNTTVTAETTTFATAETITAQWVETVAVSFKLGNGAADIVINPDKGTAIPAANFPANPTWTGYDFDGWNLLLNGKGVQVANTTVFTRNINVYAVWKAKVIAPVDFVLLKDGAESGNGTDPGTAVITTSKKNASAFTGNYGNVLDQNFSFPTGFNYTSYSSLTIKYVFTKADGTVIDEEVDGLAQFKLRASGTDVALQYNLGGPNGVGNTTIIGEKIPLPLSTVGEGCPKPELYGSINNIFIQSGGQTTTKSVGFIEITEITFHTSMSGDAVVINIDEPSLTDPLFTTISNQTWKVSGGDLTISVPAGYDLYRWAINGEQQTGTTRSLTLTVANYANKINTNVTVTAFAVIGGMPYSKTIVVKVAR